MVWELAQKLKAKLRALYPPWGILGILAGNSLLFRYMPRFLESQVGEVSGPLIDSIAAIFAIGSIAIQATAFSIIGLVFEWLMFLYLLYKILPTVFTRKENAPDLFHSQEFRVLTTATVFGLALPISSAVPTFAEPPRLISELSPFGGLLGIFASIGSIFLILNYLGDRPPHEWIEFAERVFPQNFSKEEQQPLLREDRIGEFNRRGLATMVGAYVALLCLVIAALAGFVSILSPIPESLVLLIALAAFIPEKLFDWSPDFLRNWNIDIESRFYRLGGYFFSSRKGFSVFLIVHAGAISMIFGYISLAALFGFVTSIPELVIVFLNSPFRAWNALGYGLCLITLGLYAVWFWIRAAIRLPRLLVDWEESVLNESSLIDRDDIPPLVTRPLGFLALPSTLWIIVIGFARQSEGIKLLVLDEEICEGAICHSVGNGLIPTLTNYHVLDWPFAGAGVNTLGKFPGLEFPILTVGWPIAFLLTVYSIYWTRHNPPQPAPSDNHILVFASVIQLSWGAILFSATGINLSIFEIVPSLLLPPLVIGMHYVPDMVHGHLIAKATGGGVTFLVLIGWTWFTLSTNLAIIVAGLVMILAIVSGFHFNSRQEIAAQNLPLAAIIAVFGIIGISLIVLALWMGKRHRILYQLLGWVTMALAYSSGYYFSELPKESSKERIIRISVFVFSTIILIISLRWLWTFIIPIQISGTLGIFDFISEYSIEIGLFVFAPGLGIALILKWSYSVILAIRD